MVNSIPTPRIVTCNLSPSSTLVFGLTVTELSNSLNVVVISTGLTSKTGTVTSFLVLSLNVNPTVTTFLPSTSLIRPLFFTSLAIGCGCACGTVTLFNTRLYSVAGTLPCSFLALAALTDTSGIVKVGFVLFASVVSNGTSISSLEPSG